MSGMLTIERQRKLFWSPSSAVFDLTVERMGELMKDARPDIANEFLGSTWEASGIPYLNIEEYPLEDKEYVLTILIQFRHQLAEEGRIIPEPLMKYDAIDKRLADFEDNLRKAIEHQCAYATR